MGGFLVDENKVRDVKIQAMSMCSKAGVGHVTSAFSCAEIVSILFYEILKKDPHNPEAQLRDRFIMSKNHGSVITYPILMDLGFIDKEMVFLENGSHLGIHTKLGIKGVDFCGGSLGIGLGFAAGIAYGAKLNKEGFLTFCIVGDGELYEGSIWESLMFASSKELDNLIVIIDRNKLCITDYTENIIKLESIGEKMNAFGFETREINGHSLDEIRSSLLDIRERIGCKKPLCIIANTKKGNGVDFFERSPLWHGKAPNESERKLAEAELKNGGVDYGK